MPIQTAIDSISNSQGSPFGFKNRLINGGMVIDQRNGGASGTGISPGYPVDRWAFNATQSSKFTWQQNAGSVTPPVGFTRYVGVTSSSAYTLTSNDYFQLYQIIEGLNVADLDWGLPTAQPATLSFWVRSSLTGTFGGSIATTKSAVWVMPFSYTISSANTWTYITVPVTAPTATGGTNNDNTSGIFIRFGLGSAGTSIGGTVGVWTNAGNYIQPSGTVNVAGTNGATWYITGVQFEKGTQATAFDYRPYGTELALCQRYYYRTVPGGSARQFGLGYAASSTITYGQIPFPVTMRTTPTALEQSGTAGDYQVGRAATAVNCSTVPAFDSGTTPNLGMVNFTVASGLTVGEGVRNQAVNSTAYLGFSAEF